MTLNEKEPLSITEENEKGQKEEITGEKWYSIDTYMLPAKLCNLLSLANLGIFKPYTVLFFVNSGLTPSEAGLVNGLCYIGTMIGAPIWGFLADKYQAHKILMFLILLFSLLSICSLPIISYTMGNKSINLCPNTFNETMTNHYQAEIEKTHYTSTLFWTFLVINIMAYVFEGAIVGFINAGTIQRINSSPKTVQFGRQRVYGAVGHGLGALLGGFLIEVFPSMSINCYTGVFMGYFIMMVLLMFSSMWLFHGLKIYKAEKRTNIALLKSTLSHFHVLFFLMTVVIIGVEQGIYVFYNSVYLKDMKASTMVNGIAMAIGAFSCILSFVFAEYIIKFVGGTWNSLLLCCFSHVVRFLFVAYIENPWLIMIVQPLLAIGVGLFIATHVEHVREISKSSIMTTMYSITNVCQYSIAYIIANIVGGEVYDAYGGRVLFLGASILAGVWSILMGIFILINSRKKEIKTEKAELEDLSTA